MRTYGKIQATINILEALPRPSNIAIPLSPDTRICDAALKMGHNVRSFSSLMRPILATSEFSFMQIEDTWLYKRFTHAN